jgi:pimeloyl-ACP methyl ester carboxylesterase
MDFIDSYIQRLNLNRRDVYIATAAAVLLGRLVSSAVAAKRETQTRPLIYRAPGPRRAASGETPLTKSKTSGDDGASVIVPYPRDCMPGGRDVDSPYGNTRVYEWGPLDGKKVLFIHGISTPCIALAPIARLLSAEGCRVMLFDLFGRGYSDAPDPKLYRQDIGLFSSQVFSVLASSPLDWCSEGFALVGYSLGGGIAASFASYYPLLVRSLVLLAPGGLIDPQRMSVSSHLLYGGLLPDLMVNSIVRLRLRMGGEPRMRPPPVRKTTINITSAVEGETPDPTVPGQDGWLQIFDGRPKVSPDTAVAWQVDAHPGFLPSFISSLKHGPIYDIHDRYRTLGEQCEVVRGTGDWQQAPAGLREGKVLLILGLQDSVILPDETANAAVQAIGAANIEVLKLKGGHDLPITNKQGCVDAIVEFWESS